MILSHCVIRTMHTRLLVFINNQIVSIISSEGSNNQHVHEFIHTPAKISFQWWQQGPWPILAKIMHSWCVESEKWVENFFHRWTSEKIPFLYFFLHKSWIWQTLGHVTKNFSYRHFHNASKECFWPKKFLNFMHRFLALVTTIGIRFLQVCK